ncbi:McrB family protein [Ferrovum myxofaciens]|uniref:McrB family protein n=1 Tax=Ferrovum myxofaciens TaxID=416213 RepID=UPI00068E56D7|nr:hypothetical protein [Ferrovum myxofaciens]
MAYDAFYQYYERKGFSFERALLTSYCLSLYTKPFVILSGISGTGKTKIAQFFNVPATQALRSGVAEMVAPPELPGKWILMTVTAGTVGGDGRSNLQYKDLDALLNQEEIASITPRIEQLKRSGASDNICEPFPLIIETPDGEDLKAEAYLQRASNPLLRIRFKSKRGTPFYDSTIYFAKHYAVGTVLKLEKVGDKRLRIVSVNDEAVINKAKEIEAKEKKEVSNICFISIRSDWTDPSAMFGYYNLVDQKYHITPLVAFILKAQENPDIPFFLILDEMNLAKVEHYFSDFLSCLESRHVGDDGKLQQEPIRLYTSSSWSDTNDDYFDVVPPELFIPPNLFVTGTVNIDESTYMFSPKVLDRANVIELNDVDLNNYDKAPLAIDADGGFLLNEFPAFTEFIVPTKKDYAALPEEGKIFLKNVHAILTKHQLQFGYRVINEISRYVLNTLQYCETSEGLVAAALDFQVVQKVLPKFSGPQSKLELPLRELLQFLTGSPSGAAMDFDAIMNLDPEVALYPRSVAKLQRMTHNLAINGFANFIE